ncbi:hypothetical protein ADICYQ_4508 [Cyclobacterium qasimii M12-11B]|uniref:Uncharacterized protein n=1 Tax=Cyclobacterium qasimii M12-11B TaxID=641524 RepID=S7WI06_9BACT|nr:hypothetical protein ADICYQ_4508 [Cyclobacterium qasimii M12-11B]
MNFALADDMYAQYYQAILQYFFCTLHGIQSAEVFTGQ